MTLVTIKDMRAAGVCKDARHWFARHGLDWKSFVREGIDAQTLLDTNDNRTTVTRVIKEAEARKNG